MTYKKHTRKEKRGIHVTIKNKQEKKMSFHTIGRFYRYLDFQGPLKNL